MGCDLDDVALSLATLRVLRALCDGPTHGNGFVARSGLLTGGAVYPILHRLEAAGWVESAWEDVDEAAAVGRRPRRIYSLSRAGEPAAHRLLAEIVAELAPPRSRSARPLPTPRSR